MTQSPPSPFEVPDVFPDGRYELQVNEFVPCDWCSIFNSPEFFNLHKTDKSFYFQLCLGASSRVVAVSHFSEIEPGYFRSPRRGTFGGFEFSRALRIETVEHLVDQVESTLKANGANKIEIMDAPAAFDPATSALLCNILHRRGYTMSVPDLGYLIAVDAVPIWEKLKPSRRQRINRCEREGMSVSQLDVSSCHEVYDVIERNRKGKGFPVTMSLEAIQNMLEVFPDRLSFFGVKKDGVLIASSICIKVSSSVLYVFYWGDLPGYEQFSPVSLLAEFIYDYAQAGKFRLIDFGTATKDGLPIYGLMNFKKEIGCFPSLKPSYVKIIEPPDDVR